MDEKRVLSENVAVDFEEQNPKIIKENLQREREQKENSEKK